MCVFPDDPEFNKDLYTVKEIMSICRKKRPDGNSFLRKNYVSWKRMLWKRYGESYEINSSGDIGLYEM